MAAFEENFPKAISPVVKSSKIPLYPSVASTPVSPTDTRDEFAFIHSVFRTPFSADRFPLVVMLPEAVIAPFAVIVLQYILPSSET
ncbi:MAG: hypothetical protein IJ491_09770 [Clostridia bacterium]|nr:hypothetical protein [Clostridia bacterium]